MSRLEAAAKRRLTPLVRGLERTISADDRAVIAAWACKTAMLIEQALPVDDKATRINIRMGPS